MKRTAWQMMSSSWMHILSLVGIISFLLFFLNLLLILTYNTSVFNETVKEKLGVYLYLDDNEATKDIVYAEAIDMQNELTQEGMEVDFYSKEDAFDILEDRLPDVIDNFEKYGIDNPLPPTMYIQFNDEEQYRILKDIVLEYESIIVNLNDLDEEGFAFSGQERRSAQVINLTNLLTGFSYFLIGIVLVIIIAFLLFGLRLTFYRFRKQVEVEKLLGAGYFSIKKPFLVIAFVVLILAFALMIGYFWGMFSLLDGYFISVFEQSVYDYLLPLSYLGQFLVEEFVILMIVSLLFSLWFLTYLIRKV